MRPDNDTVSQIANPVLTSMEEENQELIRSKFLKSKNATTKVQAMTINKVRKEMDLFGCFIIYSFLYPANKGGFVVGEIILFLKFIEMHNKDKKHMQTEWYEIYMGFQCNNPYCITF